MIFNPEFLTEENFLDDFKNQNRIILGGSRKGTNKLRQIYSKVFPKATIVKTGDKHAEMVKYFTNTFLATKVSFANEMYSICEQIGIDYDKVVEYATYDERLGKSHWAVEKRRRTLVLVDIVFQKIYQRLSTSSRLMDY